MTTRLLLLADTHVPKRAKDLPREMWRAIDEAEEPLEPLKNFVLPGGPPEVTTLHFARTVSRRAERRVLTLSQREPVRPSALVYLNRLADLLFVLARRVSHEKGCAEVAWAPRGRRA